jgi:hypothetical protein
MASLTYIKIEANDKFFSDKSDLFAFCLFLRSRQIHTYDKHVKHEIIVVGCEKYREREKEKEKLKVENENRIK